MRNAKNVGCVMRPTNSYSRIERFPAENGLRFPQFLVCALAPIEVVAASAALMADVAPDLAAAIEADKNGIGNRVRIPLRVMLGLLDPPDNLNCVSGFGTMEQLAVKNGLRHVYAS